MHMEGRSYSDEKILKVVELNKDESGLHCQTAICQPQYQNTTFLTFLLSLHFFFGIRCQSYNYFENQFPEKIYSSNLCTKTILFKKLAARWRYHTLQTFAILMYITPSLTLTGNMMDCVVNIKCLSH